MAPTQYRVRNWSKFQHYKNRNPPWIKLHVEILSSEDWVSLADASKLLAIACMIIASKNDGMVPDNPEYIQRVAYLEKRPNLKPLIECGFLEILQADASDNVIALADARPEKETEAEKETQVTTTTTEVVAVDFFEDFFKAMPRQWNRAAAETAFRNAITKTSTYHLIHAAKRYAIKCKGFEDRFILSPAKWLDDERWDDFPLGNGRSKDPENEAFQAKMREKYGY